MARPLGVTIIAILGFIGAILGVIGGLMLFSVGTFLTAFLGPLGFLGSLAGIAVLIIGIVEFIIAYGLWKMKKWAWLVELIILAIGILLGIASLVMGSLGSIISIVIGALVAYYLYSKRTLFT